MTAIAEGRVGLHSSAASLMGPRHASSALALSCSCGFRSLRPASRLALRRNVTLSIDMSLIQILRGHPISAFRLVALTKAKSHEKRCVIRPGALARLSRSGVLL